MFLTKQMKYCIASGGVGRLSQLFVESHDFNFKKGGTLRSNLETKTLWPC